MQKHLIGQKHPAILLQKLLKDDFQGRTLIFHGNPGCGKFTAGLLLSQNILEKDPFLSPDFLFYRNDNFSLKTRFFLKNIANEKLLEQLIRYLKYLLGRISQSIFLGELPDKIKDKKIEFSALREELEFEILNNSIYKRLTEDKDFAGKIERASDELTKKQKIPIDFIREAIDFYSQRASGHRKITLIGEFENATVQAQNSALKLFEEPPAQSLIILTVTDLSQILPTILSRSIVIKFDRLSPQSVKTIFGENPGNHQSTIDLMSDVVYQYRVKRQNNVREFFAKIAPQVQHGYELFRFIDTLNSDEVPDMQSHFLEELIDYFRNLQMLRQQFLRQTDFKPFVDQVYADLPITLIRNSNSAELQEICVEIDTVWKKIRYGNTNPQVVFPVLLLNISRWYQKKAK
jgi:DNA polymerase III delta prime subunit